MSLFSSLAQDPAVIQTKQNCVPVGKAENSLPSDNFSCTEQIGMQETKWLGEAIKLIKPLLKVHRITLKTEKGEGKLGTTLCYHCKDCAVLENFGV